MIKKIFTVVLTAIIAFTFAGCNRGKDDEDPNRTQLYVGIFEGGYGTEWLYLAKEAYEKINPEIEIRIVARKNEFTSTSLLNTISINKKGAPDIYFTPMNYYDFISQDKLMDITDTVNEKLTEYGENQSIADKMYTDMYNYYSSYKNQAGENRVFAIPFGGSVYSLNYDVDLFEEKQLFFGLDGEFTGTGEKSLGQDGIAGTYDDGLPVTWDDFKLLLEEMYRIRQVTPFIWSNVAGYRQGFFTSFLASHEGAENFYLNKTMQGQYTFLNSSTPTDINIENAYLLQGQTGKLRSLEFAKHIIDNSYYHANSFQPTNDYLAAQDLYLMSSDNSPNPIAFLIEGGHWYNEARDTISMMDYEDRRFGIMPFPKFNDSTAEKATYYNSSSTQAVFIRKNATQPELAKDFLKFTTSDEMLRMCTRVSGMVRSFNYSMTDDDLNSMPHYYRTVAEAFTSDTTEVVSMLSGSPIIYENSKFFVADNTWFWIGRAGQIDLNEPLETFAKNSNLSALDYFNGMKSTFGKTRWDTSFKKYFV